MPYYDKTLGQPLRELLEEFTLSWPGVTTRTMFGCPAYLADGKLFAFVVSDGVVITQVRLGDRHELEELFPTEPFKAGEREINRWLTVHVTPERLRRALPYIRRSYEYALGERYAAIAPEE